MSTTQEEIRNIVRGVYSIQKLRIQIGNRLVAVFKKKLGFKPGKKEEEISDKEAMKLLKELRLEFDRITDGVAHLRDRNLSFRDTRFITTPAELVFVDQYVKQLQKEEEYFKNLQFVLDDNAFYNAWLKNVRGVGPAMAGVILSEFDIHKAEYPSSLWKYAGLDVAPDGKGRSKRKEHLIDVTYIDKEGKEQTKKSITHNPFIKAKLVQVLGSIFIKQSSEVCPYRRIYDNYKHRLQNSPAHAEKTKMHIHNMAVRYMIKRFLVDLYNAWRKFEGLPVAPEYSEAKLGMVHKSAAGSHPAIPNEPNIVNHPPMHSEPAVSSQPTAN